MSYDSAIHEWYYYRGGPKDDGWEYHQKGLDTHLVPVAIAPAKVLAEDVDIATIPQMSVGTYRWRGYRILMENLLGHVVPFKVLEWEGES